MKLWLLALLAALTLTGCSQSPPGPAPATTGYALDSIKKGSTAVCVVCHVKEGTNKPETVSETINYKGKTYAFCNESEKAEFISEPKKYAGE